MTTCPHELDVAACATCRGTPDDDATETSRPFTARYSSPCARCSFDVEPGQLAMYVRDELVHAGSCS